MQTDALGDWQEKCGRSYRQHWPEQTERLVFGDGNTESPRLMLIGEAPGAQEALQGKPFVGKAGKNLTEFLTAVGLKRSDLYISNVVKFRPTKVSAAGRLVNRPPTRKEISWFSPWLYQEIAIVRPYALVTLGNVPLSVFVPGFTIGDTHGVWRKIDIPSQNTGTFALPLFALYHPASVIYNRSLAPVYQQDLRTLGETLVSFGTGTDT